VTLRKKLTANPQQNAMTRVRIPNVVVIEQLETAPALEK